MYSVRNTDTMKSTSQSADRQSRRNSQYTNSTSTSGTDFSRNFSPKNQNEKRRQHSKKVQTPKKLSPSKRNNNGKSMYFNNGNNNHQQGKKNTPNKNENYNMPRSKSSSKKKNRKSPKKNYTEDTNVQRVIQFDNPTVSPKKEATDVSIFYQNEYFRETIDDLFYKFIINGPEGDSSFDRVMFHVEESYWSYEDIYREDAANHGKFLPSLSFEDYVKCLFDLCPLLKPYQKNVEYYTKSFYDYKNAVPVCGALLLNQNLDKILLVKGFYSKNSWGAAKGKINKDETDEQCARREVMEEINYDIGAHLDARYTPFVETETRGKKVKLYVVSSVPENFDFVTNTVKEIGEIEWHSINEILHGSKNKTKYWQLTPFVKDLKKIIKNLRKQKNQKDKVSHMYAKDNIPNTELTFPSPSRSPTFEMRPEEFSFEDEINASDFESQLLTSLSQSVDADAEYNSLSNFSFNLSDILAA